MNDNYKSGRKPVWGLVAALLAAVWVLPPAVSTMRHLCPVRPDGVREARAVPAFARKYGVSCMQCHVAFPTLNDFGRQFKLDGYVMKDRPTAGVLQSQDKSLWTEANFPLSAIIRGRAYQKGNQNNEFQFQPIRDIDMFMAGGDVGWHVSWFGELEGVTDNNNGMAVAVGDAQLGYHYNPYLNVIAARRGFFVMDPYQSLSNFGSPTVAPRAIAGGLGDQPGLSTDQMDENKQTGYVYGNLSKEEVGGLYYAAGLSAEKDSNQGTTNGTANPRTADAGNGGKAANFRLALDNYSGLMVGAFGSFGHENVPNTNATASPVVISGQQDRMKFSKFGLDTMVEKAHFVGRAAYEYMHERDDQGLALSPLGVGKLTNHAAYAELMYVYNRGDEKAPFLVPLVRENWYQTTATDNLGRMRKPTFDYVTFQLAHYFKSNVKAFLEWTGDTKQDITNGNAVRSPKNSTWLLQYEVGF